MTPPSFDRPLRMIQWTTGTVGTRSVHAILNRPDMELAGVYAYGADKVGRDAAELCGWPESTGIVATNNIDELIALQPDACCYNPLWPDIAELEALLAAGIDVCSTAAWITGAKQSPVDLERIRAACTAGRSTIFGSGAHPGISNLVGMVLRLGGRGAPSRLPPGAQCSHPAAACSSKVESMRSKRRRIECRDPRWGRT